MTEEQLNQAYENVAVGLLVQATAINRVKQVADFLPSYSDKDKQDVIDVALQELHTARLHLEIGLKQLIGIE